MRDPFNNTLWKFLHIQRLPTRSTSLTQPLDAGVISVFKRAFLEMLSQETNIVRNYNNEKAISNGQAWSLVPYAWNLVKASTIWSCFAKTPVLPEEMREQLRRRLSSKEEQLELTTYSMRNQFKEQERAYFEHLIAEIGADNNWNIVRKGTQDAQELAEEELAAQPVAVDAEVEVQGMQHAIIEEGPHIGYGVPAQPARQQYYNNNGEPCSSPIDPSDLDDCFNYLDDNAGGYEPLSPDGMIIVRQTLQDDGSQDSLELRKLLKQVARTSSRIKKSKEGGNRDNEGEVDEDARSDTPLLNRSRFV
ncbi:hypothetical protein BGX30_006875 [Mortierella sp. GBA39]|nr:hypothetical protein BGX30_006875 [Mortierella sp. GBA39]